MEINDALRGEAMICIQPPVDSALTAFIEKIRAVDNHTHVNTVAPSDSESDALPLEALMPFDIPVRLRADNPDWLAAYCALYDYPHNDLSNAHMTEVASLLNFLPNRSKFR